MPGDDKPLETLLHTYKFLVGEDTTGMSDVTFDKKVLEELLEHAAEFEAKRTPKPTGRRAAIAAQKARKANV